MRQAGSAVLLLLLASLALAEPAFDARSEWHGIYLRGKKIGWSHRAISRVRRDGRRLLSIRLRVRMRSKADGNVTTSLVDSEKLYELVPPHRLVSAWKWSRRGEDEGTRITVRRSRGAYTIGGESIPTAAMPTFIDELTVDTWTRGARTVGDTTTRKALDISRGGVSEVKVDVTGVSDGLYEMTFQSEQGKGQMRFDRTGRIQWMRSMGFIELRAEPEAKAKAMPRPTDVMRAQYARVDKPLGPGPNVRGMILRARGPGAEHIRSGPRQAAHYDPATRVLTLRLGGRSGRVPASAADRAENLRASPRYPIRERVVRVLAEETVAEAKTDRERVARLVEFVDGFVVDVGVSRASTGLEVLEIQEGDCTEHALLFATLARAVGIPAREVTGLVYLGDKEQAFGPHVWNEVVLDGRWVPVDPTLGQTTIDATHIRRGQVGEGTAARMALSGARLEVVSINRARAKPAPRVDPHDFQEDD